MQSEYEGVAMTPERMKWLEKEALKLPPYEGAKFLCKQTGFAMTTCSLWITSLLTQEVEQMIHKMSEDQTVPNSTTEG